MYPVFLPSLRFRQLSIIPDPLDCSEYVVLAYAKMTLSNILQLKLLIAPNRIQLNVNDNGEYVKEEAKV